MNRLPALYEGALCVERTPDDERWDGRVKGERAKQDLARELWNEVCVDCPVKELCLDHALEVGEHGIWCGTTERQRAKMQRSAPPPSSGTGRSADVA